MDTKEKIKKYTLRKGGYTYFDEEMQICTDIFKNNVSVAKGNVE